MIETDLRDILEEALPLPPRLLSLDAIVRIARRRQRTRNAAWMAALAACGVISVSVAVSAGVPEGASGSKPAAGTSGPELGRTVERQEIVPVGAGVTGRAAGDADVLAVSEPDGHELLGYLTTDGASCLQVRGEVTGSCLGPSLGLNPYAAAEPVAVASGGVSRDAAGNILSTSDVPFWGAVPASTRTVRFTGAFGTREARAYAGGEQYSNRAFVLAYVPPTLEPVLLEAVDGDGRVLASRHYAAPLPARASRQ